MGKCVTLYLDANGKKHPAYYTIVGASGHAAALRSYLKAMAPVINSNLQKSGSDINGDFDKLLVQHRQLKNTRGTTGGVSASKALVSQFDSNEIVEGMVFSQKAGEMIEADPDITRAELDAMESHERHLIWEEWKDKARAYYAENPERELEYQKLKETIIKSWEPEIGTSMHKLIENFINHKMLLYKEGTIPKDMAENYKDMREDDLDDLQMKVITQINKFIDNVLVNEPDVRIETELNIDVPGWGNKSKIDLIMYYPSGKVRVLDYKFYTQKSFALYSNTNMKRLKAPVANLHNNNESLNSIQLSEYRLMLEQNGFTDVETDIIPFVLEEDMEVSTLNKKVYSDVQMKPLYPTAYIKPEVEALLGLKGIDIAAPVNQRRVKDRVSSSDTFQSALLSESARYNSAVYEEAFSRESLSRRTSESGQDMFWSTMDKTWVHLNGSKAEKDLQLDKYLEVYKQYAEIKEDSIISWLNGGMLQFKATSKVKETKKAFSLNEELAEIRRQHLADPDGLNPGEGEVESTAADDFVAAANESLNGKGGDTESALRQVFQRFPKNTHTYERLTNDSRFRQHVDQTIIVIRAKRTGVRTLVAVTESAFDSMELKNGRKNILGSFISDSHARNKMVRLDGTEFNTELLLLGSIMKEMQYDDVNLDFNPPMVATIYESKVKPKSLPMADLDHALNLASYVIPEESITPTYKKILQTKLVKKDKKDRYIIEALEQLETNNFFSVVIGNGQQPYHDQALEIKKQLEQTRISTGDNYVLVMQLLMDLQRKIHKAYVNKVHGKDNLEHNEAYVSINNLIAALKGIDPRENRSFEDMAQNLVDRIGISATTLANINNPYAVALHKEYSEASLKTQEEYWKMKNEHDRLIKRLLKAKGWASTAIGTSSTLKRETFRALFKEVDSDDPVSVKANLMMLKDPTAKGLIPEERAMIEHMIRMQKHSIKLYMGETAGNAHIASKKFKAGAMPVRKQSYESATEEGMSQESFGQKVKRAALGADRQGGQEESDTKQYEISNMFMQQQFSDSTRYKAAKYSATGIKTFRVDDYQLEYNPDILFESMILETARQKYYNEALSIKLAIDTMLRMQEENQEARTDESAKLLNDLTSLIVFKHAADPFEEQGKHWGQKGVRVASQLALAGSLPFLLQEFSVNTYNTAAETTYQFLLSVMPDQGETVFFSMTDMPKAVAAFVSNPELVNAIANRYGMRVRGVGQLKTERQRETQSTLSSVRLPFNVNARQLEIAQSLVFIARMIHDGSWPAHSLDADGVLIYDEKKDKRFFKQPGEKNLSKEELRKRAALYKFYKQRLSKENSLGEGDDDIMTRKMIKAYTLVDTQTMQRLTTERYSSLSDDMAVRVQESIWGIGMMQFRMWLVAKKEVFWKTYNPDTALKYYLKFTENAEVEHGGTWDYMGDPNEGIINSLMGFTTGLFFKEGNEVIPEELKLKRYRNIARFFNDMLWWFILGLIADQVFKKATKMVKDKDGNYKIREIPRTDMEAALYRNFSNAANDLTFFKPIYDSALSPRSSPIALISTVGRLGSSITSIFTSSVEGDTEAMSTKINSILKISGAYRGASLIYGSTQEDKK